MFDRILNQLPPQIYNLLNQIDELKGYWSASSKLTPHILEELKQTSLITSTGSSTRIEGVKMTDEEISDYLSGLKIKKFSQRDAQEVRGYYQTLNFILDQYQILNLDENTIKYLHTQLLQYCIKDEHHRGKYKNVDNQVNMTDR